MRRTWKDPFENLYNMDTQDQVIVHMYDFSDVRRGNYFGESGLRGLNWK